MTNDFVDNNQSRIIEEIEKLRKNGRSLARRLVGNPDNAEDIVQNAMIAATNAIKRGVIPENTKSWFFRIVFNKSIDFNRRQRPEESLDNVDANGICFVERFRDPVDFTAAFFAKEKKAILLKAIDGIPGPYKDAFIATEIDRNTYDEAAEVLGVPIGTIKSRVSRAKQHLRNALFEDTNFTEVFDIKQ